MLEDTFLKFVQSHSDQRAALLGLSGGPDSTALFHLLLWAKQPFHVAHIDHGWRKESHQEATFLQKMCREHHIPFHLKKLEAKIEKNLEDYGRNERLLFFDLICKKENLQGVFLAHHADDLAETVLKRIFEGANLYKIKGLEEISEWNGLKVFRPFLPFRKKTVLEWLENQKISYFEDPTNSDDRFLRSRLRKRIVPELSKEFGKELTKSLCRLSKQSQELNELVEELLLPFKKRIVQKEGIFFLNLEENPPKSDFLWKAVVKDFLKHVQLCPSDSILETIVFHLKKRSPHIAIRIGKQALKIDKNILSISEINDFE